MNPKPQPRPRAQTPRQRVTPASTTRPAEDAAPGRQRAIAEPAEDASTTALTAVEDADPAAGQSDDDDLPAWSHHSLVNPAQLTPMLRHYVELKASHPERVLLYRLGDASSAF